MQPSRYLYGGGYAGTLDVGNANSLITVISTIPRHKSFPYRVDRVRGAAEAIVSASAPPSVGICLV